MRLRPDANVLLSSARGIVLVELHQAISISPGSRLDRRLILRVQLDSARGRREKRKEHSSNSRELHIAMLKVKKRRKGKKHEKRVKVRERRKRPNVNEGAMVKWALLSIRPRGRMFAAVGIAIGD